MVFLFCTRDTRTIILGLMNKGDGKKDDLNALRPLHDLHRAWEKHRHPDTFGTLFFYFFSIQIVIKQKMAFRSLVRVSQSTLRSGA